MNSDLFNITTLLLQQRHPPSSTQVNWTLYTVVTLLIRSHFNFDICDFNTNTHLVTDSIFSLYFSIVNQIKSTGYFNILIPLTIQSIPIISTRLMQINQKQQTIQFSQMHSFLIYTKRQYSTEDKEQVSGCYTFFQTWGNKMTKRDDQRHNCIVFHSFSFHHQSIIKNTWRGKFVFVRQWSVGVGV